MAKHTPIALVGDKPGVLEPCGKHDPQAQLQHREASPSAIPSNQASHG